LFSTMVINGETGFDYFMPNPPYENEGDTEGPKGERERARRSNLCEVRRSTRTDDADFSLDGLIEIIDDGLQIYRREKVGGVYHLVAPFDGDVYFKPLLYQDQGDPDGP